MSREEAPNVVVIGAAGFVGLNLLAELSRLGVTATAAVRGTPEILQARTSLPVARVSDLTSSFGVVINLAYPTEGHEALHGDANSAIVEQAIRLVRPGGRLIHVSTCAVFGPALERPVSVGPVRRARDIAYVELKIDAEHRFDEAQSGGGFDLEIVRLGNVLGPASPGWATGLVRRMLTGQPVVVEETPGWSNATDVRNAAAYLAFLATGAERATGVRYHHVSEFYDVPWLRWLEPLAANLGVNIEAAPRGDLAVRSGVRGELATAFAEVKPRALYRALNREPVLGSFVRAGLSKLPRSTFYKMKGPDDVEFGAERTSDGLEQILLAIMAGQQQFPPATLVGWEYPVALRQSVEDTLAWLQRA